MVVNRVADAHVDVLLRMVDDRAPFYGESSLQASAQRLQDGGVHAQVFALFAWPTVSGDVQLRSVLRMIDAYHERVVRPGALRAVQTMADWRAAEAAGEIAGLLSVEGGGCLQGNADILRVLYRLGVRGMGLTWNHANELADGCREGRGGGLTSAGRDVIQEMERLGMWIDVAHLADAGVFDIFRLTHAPVMASHANARAVHPHPRNLTDDVIRELIGRDGWMGLTLEASFLADSALVSVEHVFRHLDHVLSLGGHRHIGLGSDFDGTSQAVQGLGHAGEYAAFAALVVDRYGDELANDILFANFERYLSRVLSTASPG